MSVVPRNKLQERFVENTQEHLAPDPFTFQQVNCTIAQVFDIDYIQNNTIANNLVTKLAQNPGLLYARVVLSDSRTSYVLPFLEPEEHIYSVYGNSTQLEGRSATIHYRNMSPESGYVSLKRNSKFKHLSLEDASTIYDIGSIG